MSPEELETLLPYTQDFNLSYEQRVEMVHTVWGLMESFVNEAWGVHPVQLTCEYLEASNLQSHNTDQISNKRTLH